MSELLDQQVNAQKEKNFQGLCKLSQARKKVYDEGIIRRKQHVHKILYSWKEDQSKQFARASGKRLWIQ